MIVKEMIEWLETLDPELLVGVAGYQGQLRGYISKPFDPEADAEVGDATLHLELDPYFERK
tara:strand:+ start:254 stop:436 length:183 start_codon:yes stop_codon:yes gene_type:complete